MRRTNKDLLLKGIKKLGWTVALMFMAPIIIWQAFKNEGNPLYWPVLIIGLIMAASAIYMGFMAIKTVMDAVFGKKKT